MSAPPFKAWRTPPCGSRLAGFVLALAARGFAAVFVAISAAIAMQMALSSGADDVRRGTMAAVAIAGLAALMLGPHLTLARGRYLAALFVAPVWLAAVCYNSLSALEYFDRYLADAAATREVDADRFKTVRDKLDDLRAKRQSIKTARDVATIDAELSKVGAWSPKRPALEAEREEAVRRDKINAGIEAASAELVGHPATATTTTSEKLAGVLALMSRIPGVTIKTSADARAFIALFLIEAGAALIPLAMALAVAPGRRRERPAGPQVSERPASGLSGHVSGPSVRPELTDVLTWLNHRTSEAPGALVPAADLFSDYAAWAAARGAVPLSRAKFGAVLSDDFGLEKRKAGARWIINYIGISLRPEAPTSTVRRGLALITGDAA